MSLRTSYTSRGALVFFVAAVAAVSVPAQELPEGYPSLHDTVLLLESRDEALGPVYYSYRGRAVSTSPALPIPSPHAYGGEFYMGREDFAFRGFDAIDGEPKQLFHAAWDGIRLRRTVWNVPLPRQGPNEVGSPTLLIANSPGRANRPLVLPSVFGLRRTNLEPWATSLRNAKDLLVLGTREVLGRECLELAIDLKVEDSASGRFESPVVACIDVHETLLVLQWELLTPAKDPGFQAYGFFSEEAAAARLRTLGGEAFLPSYVWTTTGVEDVAPGLWIPTRGVRTTPVSLPHVEYVVTSTHEWPPTRANAALFEVELEDGGIIDDQVRESYSRILPGHTEALGITDTAFISLVDNVCDVRGEPHPQEAHLIGHPFSESSCGPNALFLVATLSDLPQSLGDILQVIPEEARTEGTTSLANLDAGARAIGLQSLPVLATGRAKSDLLRSLDTQAHLIVHLAEDSSSGHFAYAAIQGDQALLVSPPGKLERMQLRDLTDRWSGNGLLLSLAPITINVDAPFLDRSYLNAALALMGVLAAASLSWTALRKRTLRRAP